MLPLVGPGTSYSGHWEHGMPKALPFGLERKSPLVAFPENLPENEMVYLPVLGGETRQEDTMAEQLVARVREAARGLDGVDRAFVSADRRRFLLVGRSWTADLSRAAASLSLTLSRDVGRNETWISGGYRDLGDLRPPSDMECIFTRR